MPKPPAKPTGRGAAKKPAGNPGGEQLKEIDAGIKKNPNDEKEVMRRANELAKKKCGVVENEGTKAFRNQSKGIRFFVCEKCGVKSKCRTPSQKFGTATLCTDCLSKRDNSKGQKFLKRRLCSESMWSNRAYAMCRVMSENPELTPIEAYYEAVPENKDLAVGTIKNHIHHILCLPEFAKWRQDFGTMAESLLRLSIMRQGDIAMGEVDDASIADETRAFIALSKAANLGTVMIYINNAPVVIPGDAREAYLAGMSAAKGEGGCALGGDCCLRRASPNLQRIVSASVDDGDDKGG